MKHLDQTWWTEQARVLDELLDENVRLLAENLRLREACRDERIPLPPDVPPDPGLGNGDIVATVTQDLGSLASGLAMHAEALRRQNQALQAASGTSPST
jgi:hypothetical protein